MSAEDVAERTRRVSRAIGAYNEHRSTCRSCDREAPLTWLCPVGETLERAANEEAALKLLAEAGERACCT